LRLAANRINEREKWSDYALYAKSIILDLNEELKVNILRC
jgi:hypothetical protein